MNIGPFYNKTLYRWYNDMLEIGKYEISKADTGI